MDFNSVGCSSVGLQKPLFFGIKKWKKDPAQKLDRTLQHVKILLNAAGFNNFDIEPQASRRSGGKNIALVGINTQNLEEAEAITQTLHSLPQFTDLNPPPTNPAVSGKIQELKTLLERHGIQPILYTQTSDSKSAQYHDKIKIYLSFAAPLNLSQQERITQAEQMLALAKTLFDTIHEGTDDENPLFQHRQDPNLYIELSCPNHVTGVFSYNNCRFFIYPRKGTESNTMNRLI